MLVPLRWVGCHQATHWGLSDRVCRTYNISTLFNYSMCDPRHDSSASHIVRKSLKPIFHQKTGWRRVEFASPTQKSSLKSTWPTPGRTQNCRREVYSTGLASGKFRVTSAGVGFWRRIENEADQIQDGGAPTQTTRVGDRNDAPGGLLRPGGR